MALEIKYPHVFTPVRVGTMKVKNRIQYAPIVSAHAETESGRCTGELLEFVGTQARSGAGIVTIGSSPIDFDRARDFYGCLSVFKDSDVPSMRLLAEEVHRYGAKISVETTHAGMIGDQSLNSGKPAFVPSVIPALHDGMYVAEMDKGDMHEVIEHWTVCIRHCREAGFDMASVCAAHGHLLSAFLSPLLNHRTDEYGGSPENRRRFPLEVLKALRAAAGNKMALELRISGDEHAPGGTSCDERIAFLQEAQKYVDMVSLSAGLNVSPQSEAYTVPSYYLPHMVNADYAARVVSELEIPVSVSGGVTTVEEAEEMLASGKADIVAMARPLIADPELVAKARSGRGSDIRPCLRCQWCTGFPPTGSQLRCAVNPIAGRESRYPEIHTAPVKKKVIVVGGGTAGMTAARTLTARGHDVILYERDDRLGGRLYEASSLWLKDGFRRYLDWSVEQTEKCGVKIVLNTFVTPDLLEREAPDAVIVAIGAEEIKPPIAGAHRTVSVAEADRGLKSIGHRVVICGAGLSGTECALQLAHQGHDVTLVDAKSADKLCRDTNARTDLFDALEVHGVKQLFEAHVTSIGENIIKMIQNGQERVLPCDTAIAAFGLRPTEGIIESLVSVVPDSWTVGDAASPGLIADANMSAFNISINI